MRLSPALLETLPPDVAGPRYKRDAHGIGIVHLGIGAFHRAHQAAYVDDALARHGGDWRILGVSLRSPAIQAQLQPQDGLYTLVEQGSAGDRRRVIGSVAGVLVAPEAQEQVLAALAAPTTHLVMLTITEKGYGHDPASGRLDAGNPDIAHDLAAPAALRSAIGFLVAALARRRAAGTPPPTILSCDNLPNNGALLARLLRDFAARRDPDLADWIEDEVVCPATMIDRIVPATTLDDVAALEAATGYRDEAMVKTEPFKQWVVEDRFAGPRPRLEEVGVQLVPDVAPFELAKLRMLNGSHSTLAYLGTLAGFAHVHEAIADPAFRHLVRRLMLDEAAPTLPLSKAFDAKAYAEALLERFANPALRHRLAQIAMDGSQKLPQRLLGTIRDRLAERRSFDAAALGVAAWIRYATGEGENGSRHKVDDPLASRMATLAARAGPDPDGLANAFLDFAPVFGDLGEALPVRRAAAYWLRQLIRNGATATVTDFARSTQQAAA